MDYDDIALKKINKLQKQSDLLTLGLLQEKNKVADLISAAEGAIIALCSNCSAGPIANCYTDTKNMCNKGKASMILRQAIAKAEEG